MVCIRVSPVPPDFEIATKRVVASGSRASSSAKLCGSRLSMKCRRGGGAQRADARHREAGKLRQRLAAEARAAGAENDDVGRAGRPAGAPCPGSSPDRRGFPAAAATADRCRHDGRAASRARPPRAPARPSAHPLDAVRADVFLARIVDGLKDAHAVICLESRAGRNGRNNATAIPWFRSRSAPSACPATVTSMPPP